MGVVSNGVSQKPMREQGDKVELYTDEVSVSSP